MQPGETTLPIAADLLTGLLGCIAAMLCYKLTGLVAAVGGWREPRGRDQEEAGLRFANSASSRFLRWLTPFFTRFSGLSMRGEYCYELRNEAVCK